MNKNKKTFEDLKQDDHLDNSTLENKVVEQSLESHTNSNAIDESNAYYSERYGWTLRKN